MLLHFGAHLVPTGVLMAWAPCAERKAQRLDRPTSLAERHLTLANRPARWPKDFLLRDLSAVILGLKYNGPANVSTGVLDRKAAHACPGHQGGNRNRIAFNEYVSLSLYGLL